MSGRWLAVAALARAAILLVALSGGMAPAAAQPASQVAFRAVLQEYDRRAEAEDDVARLRALEAERAADLVKALATASATASAAASARTGEGPLGFAGWRLVLSGTEPTPGGGLFLRFLDPALDAPGTVRPTYWNSGPGAIGRQAGITAKSPLFAPLRLLKRGTIVVVSGSFFPDDHGGPYFESARISSRLVEVERAKFRLPYFAVRLDEVEPLFPEPRFP